MSRWLLLLKQIHILFRCRVISFKRSTPFEQATDTFLFLFGRVKRKNDNAKLIYKDERYVNEMNQ